MPKPEFDPDTFVDFVASHGFGVPTDEGVEKGHEYMQDGMDYAEAAAEVISLAEGSPELNLMTWIHDPEEN